MDGRILFSARDGYRNPSGIWEQGTGGWRLQGFTTFSFPPAELPKCCLSARGAFLGQQQLLLSCQSSLSNTRTNQGAEWRHCGEGRLQGPGQLSKASPSTETFLAVLSPCAQLALQREGTGQQGCQEWLRN